MERASEIARRSLRGCMCAPFGAAISIAVLDVVLIFAQGRYKGIGPLIASALDTAVFAGFVAMLGSLVLGFPILFLLALIAFDNLVVLTLIGGAAGVALALTVAAFFAVAAMPGAVGLLVLSVPVIGGAFTGGVMWVCSRPTTPAELASESPAQ